MEKPNWILEYWREIESGRAIVSARVRKVYGRLANEITSPDPESLWRFDVGKANDPIEFIQLFCRQSHGEWIGRPLQLGLFQKAYISALFGFVGKVDGMRRYNETLFVIGRKNGKSTLASGLAAYMLIADGEGGAEIYSVATKKDQARIVFKESVNMVRQSPDLSRRIKKHRQDLAYEATFSKFEALASDSNTLDGLNTHLEYPWEGSMSCCGSHGPCQMHRRDFLRTAGLAAAGLARVALTGRSDSPPMFDTVELIGKGMTLKRLRKMIDRLS